MKGVVPVGSDLVEIAIVVIIALLSLSAHASCSGTRSTRTTRPTASRRPTTVSRSGRASTKLLRPSASTASAVQGYEADDILATLARAGRGRGRETVIVTGDRDALQLAGETSASWPTPRA